MFNVLTQLVESAEGLDISLKVGTVSELVIKGDFVKMAKMMLKYQRELDKCENANEKDHSKEASN
jgi:hypothetical protein